MQWRWVLTLFHTTGNVSLHFPWLSCRHCPIYFEVWRPHLPWQGTLCCFLLNLLLFYCFIDLYKSKRSRCNISVHGWLSLIVFFCCVSSSALVCQLPFGFLVLTSGLKEVCLSYVSITYFVICIYVAPLPLLHPVQSRDYRGPTTTRKC